MIVKVFHCSPDRILNFDFRDGVHFGGYMSALRAGDRKLDNINLKYNENQSSLFLHQLDLEVNLYWDSLDRGGAQDWADEIMKARIEGFDIIRYVNKYEPDYEPSYIVLNPNIIKLKSIETLNQKDVKEIIQSRDDSDDFFLF